jgi:transcriptional regulator with XRE-family HTH domain
MVGTQLREWRERRRLTQLELALDAGISTRHLSFVETGRSQPGRELLMKIVEQLEVPLRERNQLLLAAGHAPAFAERSLEDPDLAPVRETLDRILTRHEPYPALAVDRLWNVVAVNSPIPKLLEWVDLDPKLLEPPVNAVRVAFHPAGLVRFLANAGEWRQYWRERLERQIALTGDARLVAMLEEFDGYPVSDGEPEAPPDPAVPRILGPVTVQAPGGELSFHGLFATFEAPFEVTTSELAIELLYPADQGTAQVLESI